MEYKNTMHKTWVWLGFGGEVTLILQTVRRVVWFQTGYLKIWNKLQRNNILKHSFFLLALQFISCIGSLHAGNFPYITDTSGRTRWL